MPPRQPLGVALHWNDLRTWRGTLGRRDFALWGVVLAVVKYNLDRIVAAAFFGQSWFPWNYLLGDSTSRPATVATASSGLYYTLLAMSLPFIAWGIMLTLRRLRDAGWPAALVVFFFVPFVNLLFFVFLCLQPTRQPPPLAPIRDRWWRRALVVDNAFAAAALGIGASVLLGLGLTAFGAAFLQNYGWGLFVGIPFMMGFFSSLFYSLPRVRTFGECAVVALLSMALVAGGLLLLAFEGFICILMAVPIGFVLALFGALAGWAVQLERWSHRLDQIRLYAAAWIVMPLLLAGESRLPLAPPLVPATTVCEIAAPPEVVWRHVLSFSELPPPRETIFQLGIAYPVRARLEGRGVGAIRYCEFSTGPFVEPITAWEENRRLAFDVVQQPRPLREWSPYGQIEPAHLDGFFRSRRGEFRLIALPNGHTRLEGTTWYEQAIWPQAYWQPWSDHLIHGIHRRVLEHIKHEAEADRA